MRTADAIALMSAVADQRIAAMMLEYRWRVIDPLTKMLVDEWQHNERMDMLRAWMGRCPRGACAGVQTVPSTRGSKS